MNDDGLDDIRKQIVQTYISAWGPVEVEPTETAAIECEHGRVYAYNTNSVCGDFTRIDALLEDFILNERSAERGHFERSSSLRDESDTDVMGRDTDPCEMGEAESFFRGLRDGR